MQRNIEFKDFEPDRRIKTLLDRLISKLERNATTFSPELAHLRLFVDKNSAHKLYQVSMTLDLPGKVLAAKNEEYDLKASLRAAFDEIERQLKKYKASLRREHWQRPARRQEIRQIKTQAASIEENEREIFFSLITPHLNRLNHFVRHVISYAEAMGDLMPGALAPQDVVDGALVRAYREFAKRRTIPDVKSWLIRLALDQLEAEVTRLEREHAGWVSIEEDVPETPPAQEVSTLGDEILDFYQPDEKLKLEDLIPDFDALTPENEVETNELRGSVRKTLMEMPRQWRRVLLLHDLEGRSTKEIASETGKPESEIDRIVQFAREYLRQKLAGGFHFKGSRERAA
ncbi:MAG TPA: sigma-70 family RNA polymerase sigma factor [Terriglobia bacterium]|nr:sigma-70 family RNA polymerase sigma factor [Terriglobia bacterium]